MAKYTVRGTAHVAFEVDVEAEDEDGASEAATVLVERAVDVAAPSGCSFEDVDVSVREARFRSGTATAPLQGLNDAALAAFRRRTGCQP